MYSIVYSMSLFLGKTLKNLSKHEQKTLKQEVCKNIKYKTVKTNKTFEFIYFIITLHVLMMSCLDILQTDESLGNMFVRRVKTISSDSTIGTRTVSLRKHNLLSLTGHHTQIINQ